VAKRKAANPAPAKPAEPAKGFSHSPNGWLLYDGHFCYVYVNDELQPIRERPATGNIWYAPSTFNSLRKVPV
jgi:hypothetical protein